MSVEQEVRRALGPAGTFVDVPTDAADARRKTLELWRYRANDPCPGWVVVDGNYLRALAE